MKKRMLPALLLLALLCCGCASTPKETEPPKPTTPEEIMAACREATEQINASQIRMDMNMVISMGIPGEGSMEIQADLSAEATTTREPYSSYTSMTMDSEIFGEKMQMASQAYSLVEEGTLVSYTCSDGMWIRVDTGMTAEEASETAKLIGAEGISFQLDDTVTTWQEQEAICLTAAVSGEDMDAMMDTLLENLTTDLGGEAEDPLDLSGILCHMRIYLDPETYLPLAQEMTLENLETALGDTVEGTELQLTVPSCTATITYVSFDNRDPITLPEGAQEKALRWERLLNGEPDNGDGTYTIREGLGLIDVKIPEGFKVERSGYDNVVMVQDPANARRVTYTMYYVTEDPDAAGASFIRSMDSEEKIWKTCDARTTREMDQITTDTLAFTCDFLYGNFRGRTELDFYAWTPLAQEGTTTYYLLVEIEDGYSMGLVGDVIKSTDITREEITECLNAAVISDLVK